MTELGHALGAPETESMALQALFHPLKQSLPWGQQQLVQSCAVQPLSRGHGDRLVMRRAAMSETGSWHYSRVAF